MKTCPNCGMNLEDGVSFCTGCGFSFVAQAAPAYQYNAPPVTPQPVVDPFDHTADFDAKDVSENKVIAMLPYLSGWIGIIIALLAINHSDYVAFHLKQALKIQVVSTLLVIFTVLLCWTFIVPIAGSICYVILFVLKIIMFVNVCKGKAKECPIICKFSFLK